MDIRAVRQALGDAATTVVSTPTLTCYGYTPDAIAEPAFFPGEVTIQFDQTFGGTEDIEVICRLLVARSDDLAGQALLDGYLKRTGPTSVKTALEADPTLGGLCDDLHVRRQQGYRFYRMGSTDYYGAEFVVRVIGDEEE